MFPLYTFFFKPSRIKFCVYEICLRNHPLNSVAQISAAYHRNYTREKPINFYISVAQWNELKARGIYTMSRLSTLFYDFLRAKRAEWCEGRSSGFTLESLLFAASSWAESNTISVRRAEGEDFHKGVSPLTSDKQRRATRRKMKIFFRRRLKHRRERR